MPTSDTDRESQPMDPVEKPAHYNSSQYEHVKVAENWEMSSHIYCTTKYAMRFNLKGNPLQDMGKARWYLREVLINPRLAMVTYGFWDRHDQPRPKFPRIFPVDEVAKAWSQGDEHMCSFFCCIGDAILYAPSEQQMIRLLAQAMEVLDAKIKTLR